MTYDEEVDKMVYKVENDFVKFRPSKKEIDFCKLIHNTRLENRDIYNKLHPKELVRNGKISPNHTDEDLWWGLAAELIVAKIFGQDLHISEPKRVMQEWAEDQIRQNEQLLKFGYYDAKDIGKTQVRAFEYVKHSVRNIIYREKDFRSKVGQPVVGCVVNTKEDDFWVEVCGFISYEDLVARKQEFWKNPRGLGWAMFIPIWKLTPMVNFEPKWLSE